uniref:Uncharacterized protein n=1 Tax=Chromera velia CCMP2878 TaxID=1169474 RepID=A0A0G4HRL5_9ALVE|eukprot:Cvel_8102.t1-p1 / transcript=Cvel_8102.t1 / gene=Cvel_8102 / organism=Chromera_velia_CCMP2878 / gene_product=hypothetical protein / transcript_product=hypothetical protein / location=Cvel_scaffold440:70117-73008(+) / protein_length=421 / sequence_SO=supercontig / SO=protein_coding / is_pseudo=false
MPFFGFLDRLSLYALYAFLSVLGLIFLIGGLGPPYINYLENANGGNLWIRLQKEVVLQVACAFFGLLIVALPYLLYLVTVVTNLVMWLWKELCHFVFGNADDGGDGDSNLVGGGLGLPNAVFGEENPQKQPQWQAELPDWLANMEGPPGGTLNVWKKFWSFLLASLCVAATASFAWQYVISPGYPVVMDIANMSVKIGFQSPVILDTLSLHKRMDEAKEEAVKRTMEEIVTPLVEELVSEKKILRQALSKMDFFLVEYKDRRRFLLTQRQHSSRKTSGRGGSLDTEFLDSRFVELLRAVLCPGAEANPRPLTFLAPVLGRPFLCRACHMLSEMQNAHLFFFAAGRNVITIYAHISTYIPDISSFMPIVVLRASNNNVVDRLWQFRHSLAQRGLIKVLLTARRTRLTCSSRFDPDHVMHGLF